MTNLTKKVLKDLKTASNQIRPIGDNFVLPNHSGVSKHTELKPVYGSMYIHDTNTIVLILVAGTPVRIPANFIEGSTNIVTFQNNRELKIGKKGFYKIDWSVSFTTTLPSQEIEGGVMIDNVFNIQSTAHRRINTATDTGNMGGTCILSLDVNQVISLGVSNETSASAVNVQHANLSIVRIS